MKLSAVQIKARPIKKCRISRPSLASNQKNAALRCRLAVIGIGTSNYEEYNSNDAFCNAYAHPLCEKSFYEIILQITEMLMYFCVKDFYE